MSQGLKKKASLHVGPNMTPMVDIVMCILIFFMLSMSFALSELYLTNNTPVTTKGLSDKPAEGEKQAPSVQNRIEIKMVNDRPKVYCFNETIEGIDNPKDDKLWQRLTEKRKVMSKEVQIIIVPDPGVRYKDVITVYDACMKAQFEHVAFQAAKAG